MFLVGADESDFSGDAETGPDGRSVFPQTQVGQHGGDVQQLSTKGVCRYGPKEGRGMDSSRQQAAPTVFFPNVKSSNPSSENS